MNKTLRLKINKFVQSNIVAFHEGRLEIVNSLRLNDILKRKNPYLFRAKNLNAAPDLVKALLDARLSSSEEGCFGGFLEELAEFVSRESGLGKKATSEGIDLDLEKDGVRYLIAVKSGPNWGNSTQYRELERNFQTAYRRVKQSRLSGEIQPTLGICYGKFRTINNGKYLKIGGQEFWFLISDDRDLYVDIVEPLGFEAEKHEIAFQEKFAAAYTRLVLEFINDFCLPSGNVDWTKLVRFVSGNMEP